MCLHTKKQEAQHSASAAAEKKRCTEKVVVQGHHIGSNLSDFYQQSGITNQLP